MNEKIDALVEYLSSPKAEKDIQHLLTKDPNRKKQLYYITGYKSFKSSFEYFCTHGQLENLKDLIRLADVEDLEKLEPAFGMSCAAKHNHIKIIEYFFEENIFTADGLRKSLVSAATFGHLEIIKLIVRNQIYLLQHVKIAYRKAIQHKHHKVAKFLKDKIKEFSS